MLNTDKTLEFELVQEETPRYVLYSAKDALQPQPPMDWIVESVFSAGSLSVVVGEPGSKKTWSLLDLSVCVAHGKPWLKFSTQASTVLIVDEESGKRRLDRRLGQVLRGHQADENTPIHYVTLNAFDFGNISDVCALKTLILQTGARLVIVDALADVMPGRDENSVKDVQPIFMSLRQLAESTQSAIVVIHHTNKNGKYRGSTAIPGAVDLMMQITSESSGTSIQMNSVKVRDVEPFRLSAEAHFEPDQVYLTESKENLTIILGPALEYVLRFLSDKEGASVNQIRDSANNCSPSAAVNAIYNLAKKEMNFIHRTNPGINGGRGNSALYALTEKGKQYCQDILKISMDKPPTQQTLI